MDKALIQIQENLESIKKVSNDKETTEFWLARDLMPLLGYSTWRQFSEAIERAKESCKKSNHPADSHFLPAPAKSTGGQPKDDFNYDNFEKEIKKDKYLQISFNYVYEDIEVEEMYEEYLKICDLIAKSGVEVVNQLMANPRK